MYTSIIASDMLTLRGSHALEQLDDLQLADLGMERQGNTYLRYGKVVHEASRFDLGRLLTRIAALRAPARLRAARA